MADFSKNQRLIAELLAERERLHAYEIKTILEGVIGHGSVYQALSAMQAKGLVEAEWQLPGEKSEGGGPPRKYFELSRMGRELLKLERARDRIRSSSQRPLTDARSVTT